MWDGVKINPHLWGLMSAKGLEPLTNGLKGHCSTIELRARVDAGFPGALHSITRWDLRQMSFPLPPACAEASAGRQDGAA